MSHSLQHRHSTVRIAGADDENILRTRARRAHHIYDEATKRRNEKEIIIFKLNHVIRTKWRVGKRRRHVKTKRFRP